MLTLKCQSLSTIKFVTNFITIFLLVFITNSCNKPDSDIQYYLGKNPYKEAVYQDLLKLDEVFVSDIENAFQSYLSTHKLDEIEVRWVKKQLSYLKKHMDHRGYYVSPELQHERILAFRDPTPIEEIQASTILPISTGTIQNTIPNPNGEGSWKNRGPFGNPDVQWSATGSGALHYVEMHPTNPSIMYACARNAGLFKTTDYGKHWKNITSHFPTPHVYSVEVNSSNPSIIYLGGKANLFYSSDEGETWEDRSSIISGNIYDLKSDPANPNRVLIASTEGIYLTTDAGLTWTQKIAGNFSDIDLREDFSLILVTKNNSDIAPSMFYSTDKGDTWIERTIISKVTQVDKIYLTFYENPIGHDVIMAYGLVDGNTPSRFIGLYKSSFIENPAAGQDTFKFIEVKHPTYDYPNGPVPLKYADNPNGFEEEAGDPYGGINPYTTSTWVGEFWVSPNDSLRLLTAREKLWGSNNGGEVWEFKPSYGGSNWADNRYITMNTAKDTVYWCNDGGIWCIAENDLFPSQSDVDASGLSRSQYMNSKVVPKNGNICVQEGSQMDVSLLNKDVFITGGQDIGQVFERAGRSTHVASADVYRGRIKSTDDKYFITGRLNVSLNDNSTAEVYNSIESDQGNPNHLYGFTSKINGVNNTKLVRSPQGVDGWQVNGFKGENQPNAGGHSWTPEHDNWEIVSLSGTGITNQKANTFKQSKANPELAFIGDEVGNKLFYTENLSSTNPTWIELPNAPSSDLYRITTHDLYEDIVAVGTSTGVYISKNKGKDWFFRPGIPEFDIRQIVMDKNELIDIYVMTNMNVYYYSEKNSEWKEFNKGLPLFMNRDMRIAYFENGDNRLYIGKYGSGIWSSPLQSVLENNNLPIVDFKIHGNSSNYIEVGNSVQLINLSTNEDSLVWVLENGSDVITITNDEYPKIELNTPGFYKVKLTAYNEIGNISETKENYIFVYQLPALSCIPQTEETISWYRRLNMVSINDDVFSGISNNVYQAPDKTFEINNQFSNNILIADNYYPGYNFWWKGYIDYNDDGSFTSDELIFNSSGPVDTFETTFSIPANSIYNKNLHFRITGQGNGAEPDECGNSTGSNRQIIDMKIILRNSLNLTQKDSLVSSNSVKLSADYSGGQNILEGGFLLSTVDGDFDKDNSSIYSHSDSLQNTDSINIIIDELLTNTIYYYKTYLVDEGYYYYSTKDSFYIPKKKIPLTEAINAVHIDNQELELNAILYPNSANISSLTFLHGENNFSNEITLDVSKYPTEIYQYLKQIISVPITASNYQFKIRTVANGDTLYSNVVNTNFNQSYCETSTTNPVWYKKWSEITLNNFTYEDPGSTPDYEDATNIFFDLETGKSYTATFKHVNPGWHNLTFYAYIDLNNDLDFNDAGELVGFTLPNGQYTTMNIEIPTRYNLRGKDLRMRIVGKESDIIDDCTLTIGNIKDFTVHLDRCTPIRLVTTNDLPIKDGKIFWAQDSVIISENIVIPDFHQLLLDAKLVKIEGLVETDPSTIIRVDGDGCLVE